MNVTCGQFSHRLIEKHSALTGEVTETSIHTPKTYRGSGMSCVPVGWGNSSLRWPPSSLNGQTPWTCTGPETAQSLSLWSRRNRGHIHKENRLLKGAALYLWVGAASVGGVILSVIRTSALSVGSITSDTAAEYTKGLKPVYVQICMLLKTGPSPLSMQLSKVDY